MNPISFITANFVTRQINYNMTEGWMQGDKATQDFFRPLDTFAPRFDAMLGEIKAMGFEALDLWGAHLNAAWATSEHVAIARDLLDSHGLKANSFAAWVSSLENLKALCRLGRAMNINSIAGGAPFLKDPQAHIEAANILKDHGMRLGIENHPEKSPAEVLELIGDGADGHIGTAVDTGWWGTQGYSAAQAIQELRQHLVAVHLKDIKAVGAHQTCRLGQGVVDIAACVRTLQQIGYAGPLGIEHEPEQGNPTEDVKASKALVEGWLKG